MLFQNHSYLQFTAPKVQKKLQTAKNIRVFKRLLRIFSKSGAWRVALLISVVPPDFSVVPPIFLSGLSSFQDFLKQTQL